MFLGLNKYQYLLKFIVISIVVTLFANVTVSAESPWHPNSGYIQFLKQSYYTDIVGVAQVEDKDYSAVNNSCTKMQFKIKSKTGYWIIAFGQDVYVEVCAVPVAGGYMSKDGYYLKNGTTLAGKLIAYDGSTNKFFTPIYNSGALLENTPSGGSYKIKLHKNAYSNMQTTYNYDGTISYKITENPGSYLKTEAGQDIYTSPSTIKISKNSRWAILENKGVSIVRLEIINNTILTLKKININRFLDSSFDISSDGQYVVVYHKYNNEFYIIDTNYCGTNGCYSRDLRAELQKQVQNYAGIFNLELANDTIRFIAISNISTKENTTTRMLDKFAIGYNGAELSLYKNNYLALGDSFASGEGAYEYIKNTDTNDNRCHQSAISYPFLLGAKLTNLETYNSVACSGAKTKDYSFSNQTDYNSKESQANNKSTIEHDKGIYDYYLPGYRTQDNFVNYKIPNIVTISMGGNDIGFSSILKRCVIGVDTCYGSPNERNAVANTINNVYDKLVAMYSDIKSEVGNNGKVYVIGYPQIAKPNGNCAVNVHLNNQEIIISERLIKYLNSRIEMAANQAGVKYIDTQDAFTGHRLCENDSKNIAINGLEDGINIRPFNSSGVYMGISGISPKSESFHPNKIGHELYASTINQKTNGFNTTMPEPVVSSPVVKDSYYYEFIDGDLAKETNINNIYDQDLTTDIVFKDKSVPVIINSQDTALRPDSAYHVVMYSDPTNAGTVTADSAGNIDATINIPAGLEHGYHTLSIEGKNVLGEDIAIQKIVYVAEAVDDYDGDGTLNEQEVCLFVEPSGLDSDKDGIDDACDGFIDEPPETQEVIDNEIAGNNESAQDTEEPDDVQNSEIPAPEEPANPEISNPEEPIDIPNVISYDKQPPLDESRPDWLLQKEKEIQAQLQADAAAAQALAQQQPQTTTTTPLAGPESPVATPTAEQPTSTPEPTVPPSTSVQGATSSAVESKNTVAQNSGYNWVYVIALTATAIAILVTLYIRKLAKAN